MQAQVLATRCLYCDFMKYILSSSPGIQPLKLFRSPEWCLLDANETTRRGLSRYLDNGNWLLKDQSMITELIFQPHPQSPGKEEGQKVGFITHSNDTFNPESMMEPPKSRTQTCMHGALGGWWAWSSLTLPCSSSWLLVCVLQHFYDKWVTVSKAVPSILHTAPAN